MADDITKKEHYVSQCYLRNFAIAGNPEKIHVFDKIKAQTNKTKNKNRNNLQKKKKSTKKQIKSNEEKSHKKKI